MPRTIPLCIAVFCLLFAVGTARGADAKVFQAGAAVVDITPTVLDRPAFGNGYTEIADVVHDPIYARCLILHDGREPVVLLVIDNCLINVAPADQIKAIINEKTGIPTKRIMVSTTHTHAAPMLRAKPSEGETRFTLENVASAAVEAQKNLAPARIGWAVGNDPKNVFCRRFIMQDGAAPNNPGLGTKPTRAQTNPGANPKKVSPTGPVDSLIPMISVVSPDGKPIAVFASWSCHHTGRGLKKNEISADRFGVFCKEMKRRIAEKVGKDKVSDKFVAIMANGTSGDANSNNMLDPKRKYTFEDVGRDNAEAAMAVWPNIEYHDWVPLDMLERKVKVPGYQRSPEEIQAAKDYMADPDTKKTGMLAGSIKSVAEHKWKKSADVPLQAIRIGDFAIATLPGEFFGITGINLKAKSPFQPTMTIGLANGCFSYVPPPEQFELGGYETNRSSYRFLGIEAEPIIKDALIDMLKSLRDKN